jgi:hypothetical protein
MARYAKVTKFNPLFHMSEDINRLKNDLCRELEALDVDQARADAAADMLEECQSAASDMSTKVEPCHATRRLVYRQQ